MIPLLDPRGDAGSPWSNAWRMPSQWTELACRTSCKETYKPLVLWSLARPWQVMRFTSELDRGCTSRVRRSWPGTARRVTEIRSEDGGAARNRNGTRDENRQVVGEISPDEAFDLLDDRIHDSLHRQMRKRREDFLEALSAELLFLGIQDVGDAIAVQKKQISWLEWRNSHVVACVRFHTQEQAPFTEACQHPVPAKEEPRRVPCVHVAKRPLGDVQVPEEEAREASWLQVAAEALIDAAHHGKGRAARPGFGAQRGLEIREDERGRDSFARDVSHGQPESFRTEIEEVVEVAADLPTRASHCRQFEPLAGRKLRREQARLDSARDRELLFHAPLFHRFVEQPRSQERSSRLVSDRGE